MAKNIIELAADIVTSFVSHSFVPWSELPELLKTVHDALSRIESGLQIEADQPEAPKPMVSIRKSITPDYLICLDDGRKFKSLKRHLTQLGMTPAQYREKWKLPKDYPMVAPNYTATRSALAKKIGLGQLRKKGAGSRRK